MVLYDITISTTTIVVVERRKDLFCHIINWSQDWFQKPYNHRHTKQGLDQAVVLELLLFICWRVWARDLHPEAYLVLLFDSLRLRLKIIHTFVFLSYAQTGTMVWLYGSHLSLIVQLKECRMPWINQKPPLLFWSMTYVGSVPDGFGSIWLAMLLLSYAVYESLADVSLIWCSMWWITIAEIWIIPRRSNIYTAEHLWSLISNLIRSIWRNSKNLTNLLQFRE